MSISNVRDPRDDLPEILKPGDNVYAVDETAYLVRETGIEGLRVWFNIPRMKFVVEDTKAPGGPSAAYVMVVMTADGSPCDVDNRTVETIRKLYDGHKAAAEELIQAELARAARVKSERETWTGAMAEDLKWVGRNVVPSVANRERSVKKLDS